ncbi:D-serine ammonia-lyase [Sporolactobacillus putidus]|uniref:Probable D-serine dehydratase n=1 Tax=Sporolactobacillus putidus TaxID=492735 RepID=A0A917S5C7_9BACL|nr:D-serine ammonia-lyase [Sporolactobacillus putidus]GGL59233.1 putative D-serine dehydratase [Sporolactobacillus putidus]
MGRIVGGKTIEEWKSEFPVIRKIMAMDEVLWPNPEYGGTPVSAEVTAADVADAEQRLLRFAPYIERAFPETVSAHGLIESPLYSVPDMKDFLQTSRPVPIPGRLMMKADSELPISGSIKARGGIYEVLKTAERLAIGRGLLKESDNYSVLANDSFRAFFSNYAIAVGSTGNLGLSIGIMAAKLGFHTTVHMSRDARQWKKDLLREKGAEVREYEADYSVAVEEGRRQAAKDSRCHFIDDENSKDLFVGYATAGSRLKKQFQKAGIAVDAGHPLLVYLPCGVGGGPGGVTFGLKHVFGENVHAFFVEPTHSPSFLLGLLTGLHDRVSVKDFGLDNRTDADGLAVPRASAFVGKAAGHLISGCLTVSDRRLFQLQKGLADTEKLWVEPSAAAGIAGPQILLGTKSGQNYLNAHRLTEKTAGATHLFWATGGGMVPQKIRDADYEKASRI